MNKWKCDIILCYSSEKLITLNILHEVVPTWYSFHSWVDWSNADKVSCSRKQHTVAGFEPSTSVTRNRHSNQTTYGYCSLRLKLNLISENPHQSAVDESQNRQSTGNEKFLPKTELHTPPDTVTANGWRRFVYIYLFLSGMTQIVCH